MKKIVIILLLILSITSVLGAEYTINSGENISFENNIITTFRNDARVLIAINNNQSFSLRIGNCQPWNQYTICINDAPNNRITLSILEKDPEIQIYMKYNESESRNPTIKLLVNITSNTSIDRFTGNIQIPFTVLSVSNPCSRMANTILIDTTNQKLNIACEILVQTNPGEFRTILSGNYLLNGRIKPIPDKVATTKIYADLEIIKPAKIELIENISSTSKIQIKSNRSDRINISVVYPPALTISINKTTPVNKLLEIATNQEIDLEISSFKEGRYSIQIQAEDSVSEIMVIVTPKKINDPEFLITATKNEADLGEEINFEIFFLPNYGQRFTNQEKIEVFIDNQLVDRIDITSLPPNTGKRFTRDSNNNPFTIKTNKTGTYVIQAIFSYDNKKLTREAKITVRQKDVFLECAQPKKPKPFEELTLNCIIENKGNIPYNYTIMLNDRNFKVLSNRLLYNGVVLNNSKNNIGSIILEAPVTNEKIIFNTYFQSSDIKRDREYSKTLTVEPISSVLDIQQYIQEKNIVTGDIISVFYEIENKGNVEIDQIILKISPNTNSAVYQKEYRVPKIKPKEKVTLKNYVYVLAPGEIPRVKAKYNTRELPVRTMRIVAIGENKLIINQTNQTIITSNLLAEITVQHKDTLRVVQPQGRTVLGNHEESAEISFTIGNKIFTTSIPANPQELEILPASVIEIATEEKKPDVILIVSIIFLVIGILLYGYLKFKKPIPEEKDPKKPIEYRLRKELQKQGWKDSEIETIFDDIKKKP
jgi:hypothetical protein